MNKNHVAVHVSVTAKDLQIGLREHCSECPVALALNRALRSDGHPAHVSVGFAIVHADFEIAADKPADLYVGNLPSEVKEHVSDITGGESVLPFEFDLTLTKLGIPR